MFRWNCTFARQVLAPPRRSSSSFSSSFFSATEGPLPGGFAPAAGAAPGAGLGGAPGFAGAAPVAGFGGAAPVAGFAGAAAGAGFAGAAPAAGFGGAAAGGFGGAVGCCVAVSCNVGARLFACGGADFGGVWPAEKKRNHVREFFSHTIPSFENNSLESLAFVARLVHSNTTFRR